MITIRRGHRPTPEQRARLQESILAGRDGSNFGSIDELIAGRAPEATQIIDVGTDEALRLSELAGQQFQPLEQFGGLEAFNEQNALLGLSGQQSQQAAISGIPVSAFDQRLQARQREQQLRQGGATGDIGSGFAIEQAQRLRGGQQAGNIQNRLAQLEPLAATSRDIRSTLSQQAEAAAARQALIEASRGNQLSNIRLGGAATSAAGLQNRAQLSGLQGIASAQQQAQMQNQLVNLAGQGVQFFNQPQVSNTGFQSGFNQPIQQPPPNTTFNSFVPEAGTVGVA